MIRRDIKNQDVINHISAFGKKSATQEFGCTVEFINRILRGERREDIYLRPKYQVGYKIPWADDCPKDLRNAAQRIQ